MGLKRRGGNNFFLLRLHSEQAFDVLLSAYRSLRTLYVLTQNEKHKTAQGSCAHKGVSNKTRQVSQKSRET